MRAISGLALALLMLARPLPLLALEARTASFEFGDDSGEWALDGECDDMRFSGEGMAAVLLPEDIGTDATDCRTAYFDWTIDFDPLFAEPATPRDIVWGDDASDFAHDGECDDVRFTGYYAWRMDFRPEDIGHDASDCRELFVKGRARWRGTALGD